MNDWVAVAVWEPADASTRTEYVPFPTFRPEELVRSQLALTVPADAVDERIVFTSPPFEFRICTVTDALVETLNVTVAEVLTGAGVIDKPVTVSGAG